MTHQPVGESVPGSLDVDAEVVDGNSTVLALAFRAAKQLAAEQLEQPANTSRASIGDSTEKHKSLNASEEDYSEDEADDELLRVSANCADDDDELSEYRGERPLKSAASSSRTQLRTGFRGRRKRGGVQHAQKEEQLPLKDADERRKVRIGSVEVDKTRAKLLGLSLTKLAERFGLKKGDVVEVTAPGSVHNAEVGVVEEISENGLCRVRFRVSEGAPGKSLSEDVKMSSLTKVQPAVDTGGELSKKHFMAQERKPPPKSDGFFTLSDRKECAKGFKPRKKTVAELKVAISAGLKVGGGAGDDDDLLAAQSFRPNGKEDPLQEGRSKEVEWEKRFCRRQDAMITSKRKDLARSQAENEYMHVQNKKECPVCHAKQSYDEVVTKKKACRGEHCNGALYTYPTVYDRKAFEERQRSYVVKHEKGMRDLRREITRSSGLPSKPRKPRKPAVAPSAQHQSRPARQAVHGGRRRDEQQENRSPRLSENRCQHVTRSTCTPRYLMMNNDPRNHNNSKGDSQQGRQGERHRPSSARHVQHRDDGTNTWDLEKHAKHYVQGRAHQLGGVTPSGGDGDAFQSQVPAMRADPEVPSSFQRAKVKAEIGSSEQPRRRTSATDAKRATARHDSSTDQKWSSLLF